MGNTLTEPNGVITEYQLQCSGGGQVFSHTVSQTTTTLSGLQHIAVTTGVAPVWSVTLSVVEDCEPLLWLNTCPPPEHWSWYSVITPFGSVGISHVTDNDLGGESIQVTRRCSTLQEKMAYSELVQQEHYSLHQ